MAFDDIRRSLFAELGGTACFDTIWLAGLLVPTDGLFIYTPRSILLTWMGKVDPLVVVRLMEAVDDIMDNAGMQISWNTHPCPVISSYVIRVR